MSLLYESSLIQSEIDLNSSTLGFCPPRPVWGLIWIIADGQPSKVRGHVISLIQTACLCFEMASIGKMWFSLYTIVKDTKFMADSKKKY